jgi:putative hydrolase of the HAD superfamily
MTIEAVLFDYGLVLTGPADPASWKSMQQTLHADETAFHEAYWAFRHDYDRGTLSGEAYWQAVAQRVSRELSCDDLHGLIELDNTLWTQPNQPMIDWAAALQHAGVRTGILSNIGDQMEAGILARCPWLAQFAHHTFSHRLRLAKPEAAIYAHAIEGLGVAPAHILFIDDREENIAAARAVGMQAVQYTSHAEFVRTMQDLRLADLLPKL